tara:strand:- start:1079 stop:1465 length:387 start_codon:yes stop_codon:yes gene_type:complete
MREDLLTTRDDLVGFRRTINGIRQQIEYDRDYHSKSELFDELESRLNDVVEHLDEMDSKLKEHVYAYDVTVTCTRRVYVKASDECDAEIAAVDYAMESLDMSYEWTDNDVQTFRDEDEETTTVYDVEV